MPVLRTFGGLSITDDGVACTGAATQRKTLALLALLAAAGKNGLSRDKIISYLWPESDAANGRSLLKQACYALRRDLRAPDLFLGKTELRLNPNAVTSDVQAFEDALARGELSSAIAQYTGPFLDGFYVTKAGEFERWVEAERTRFTRRVCDTLEGLATDAGSRGDHRAAAEWWRRFVEIDPLSSRAILGLMTSLDDLGERAAALQRGRVYEAFVREELGAEPASIVSTLIGRLHHQSDGGLPPSHAPAATSPDLSNDRPAVQPPAAVPAPLLRHVRRAHALSLLAIGVVAVLVVGVAATGFWRRQSTANAAEPVTPPGRKMLAVLPFENRGSPADEYFADGLSEAIATRLGSIQRLGVIAWPSASQYRETEKTAQEIGRELGVQYILQGSVRWEKSSGVSRIRVSPTLIRVSDDAQLWADQYDTTLTGVFAVQTHLATRVAGALDLALADAERHLLEARPTTNLQAYDAYLRARELVDREYDVGNVRKAVSLYERAVALDSSFALAYDWLSVSYVWLYINHVERSTEQLTRAKAALDRALRVAPDLPESHCAVGFYYGNVLGDNDRALQEFTQARRLRPNDHWLPAVIGALYWTQGRWNDALAYQHEAVVLDPRNLLIVLGMGQIHSELRHFNVANYYYDRALALNPYSFDAQLGKAVAYLSQTGDLAGAQRQLPDFALNVDLNPYSSGLPIVSLGDVATLLDHKRRAQLLSLTSSALQGDSASLVLAKALVHRANGQSSEARTQFDAARSILETNVRNDPDDDYYATLLGLALAGLGRSADAIREGERAVALVPVSKDAEWSGYLRANLARIYVLLDEREKAIDQLESVLSRPGPLSVAWLRADPLWDPLRGNTRFLRLVAGKN
jgi:serine/threonine-protein kinase